MELHIEVPVVNHHNLDCFVVAFAVLILDFRVFSALLICTHGEASLCFIVTTKTISLVPSQKEFTGCSDVVAEFLTELEDGNVGNLPC